MTNAIPTGSKKNKTKTTPDDAVLKAGAELSENVPTAKYQTPMTTASNRNDRTRVVTVEDSKGNPHRFTITNS